MALVRRNQYWLPSIFNDIFDDAFMNSNIAKINSTSPAVNIIENEKGEQGKVTCSFFLRII